MQDKIINRWVILAAILIGVFLLILSLVIGFGFTAPEQNAPNLQVAELTLIPGPTSTPRILPTPTFDPAQGTATPLPGEIALYGYVQITGTAGDGLRVRAAPGLDGEPLFLGFDTELFQITDGPQEADGYTWWYLLAPYDETRSGWAAADFLEYVEAPQE
jgi:hypothetical protein